MDKANIKSGNILNLFIIAVINIAIITLYLCILQFSFEGLQEKKTPVLKTPGSYFDVAKTKFQDVPFL